MEPLVCQRGTHTQRTSTELGRPSLSSMPSRETEYMFIFIDSGLNYYKTFFFALYDKNCHRPFGSLQFSLFISFGLVSTALFLAQFSPCLKHSQQQLTSSAIPLHKGNEFSSFSLLFIWRQTRLTSQDDRQCTAL